MDESICGKNFLIDSKSEELSNEPRHHCVVVVGCHKTHPHQFVINDPAKMPFMLATALQLVRARLYALEEGDSGTRRLESKLVVIPVTPSQVRLPLLNQAELVNGERRSSFGLLFIAQRIQSVVSPDGRVRTRDSYRAGKFRLALLGGPSGLRGLENGDIGAFSSELRTILASSLEHEKWCWIQSKACVKDGRACEMVWLWDATVDGLGNAKSSLESNYLKERYLLAVAWRFDNEKWAFELRSKQSTIKSAKKDETRPHCRRVRGSLRPALISSFTTGAMVMARNAWPTEPIPACELYAFMQPEIELWCKRLGLATTDLNAVTFMASQADNLNVIQQIARDVKQKFDDIPVIAIATFLPELAAPPSSHSALIARKSLHFLGQFARELQAKTVELVSGSVIGGIWPGLPTTASAARQMIRENKRMFVANRVADEIAQQRLLDNLEVALTGLVKIDPALSTIGWAIELEPGPLFVVRDWQTLHDLCVRLDKRDSLRSVGLNLDISHWRLAARQANNPSNEITIDKLTSHAHVRRRILHGHIAGHHPGGHFGDIRLNALNDMKEDFESWISFLEERTQDDPPYVSRHLSVEIEAVKRFDDAAKSVQCLADFL